MAKKLYAADTAAFALKFGLQQLPAVLRLGWLPILLVLTGSWMVEMQGGQTQWGWDTTIGTVDGGLTMGHDAGVMIGAVGNAAQPPDPVLGAVGGVIFLVGVILLVPFFVLFIRIAAGQVEVPKGFFYWQWTKREWLTVGAAFFAIIMLMGLLFVCLVPSIVFFKLTSGLSWEDALSGTNSVEGGPMVFILLLIGMLAFFWLAIRLTLVAAIPATENRFAPLHAFRLTAGVFWGLLGTWVLITLAIILLIIPLSLLMAGIALPFEMAEGMGTVALITFLVMGLVHLYQNLVTVGFYGRVWERLSIPKEDAKEDAS